MMYSLKEISFTNIADNFFKVTFLSSNASAWPKGCELCNSSTYALSEASNVIFFPSPKWNTFVHYLCTDLHT